MTPRGRPPGEGLGAAGAGVVVLVVTEAEVLVEVEGAVVVGDEVGATEVAAPATTGPPWPSVGVDTAGDRSHPKPAPTPPASSIAATSPTTAMRRRPFPDPAVA